MKDFVHTVILPIVHQLLPYNLEFVLDYILHDSVHLNKAKILEKCFLVTGVTRKHFSRIFAELLLQHYMHYDVCRRFNYLSLL